MTGHGRRYLTSNQFTSYCSALNLKLSAFDRELELYDKEGVLLPVARIIQPDEYVIKRWELEQDSKTYEIKISEWEELERIIFGGPFPQFMTDFDLWHPFDREFEQNNKFLFRPTKDQFKRWNTYRVNVRPNLEEDFFRRTVKHYYHYYQVHQVFAIQQKYPVFAKYNWLLKEPKDALKNRISYLIPKADTNIISLNGYLSHFDALSFYIELYKNEEERTLEPVPEIGGIKTLNAQQFAHYENQLKRHAEFVVHKFGITDDDLYEFLFYLLDLRSEYKRGEHLKLANELTIDLQYLTKLLAGFTGLSFSDLENEILQRNELIWVRQRFRHLDKALQVYDYAHETFERLRNNYNTSFPNFQISLNEIDSLISFIEKKGLFVIPYAVFDIHETLNDSRPFRATFLYMGLSNLTTGFECYLREIAVLVNSSTNAGVNTEGLHTLIQTMFRTSWGNQFNMEHSKRISLKSDPFLYLEDVYTSPNLDEIIKLFLLIRCSRNFVAHNYTLEHDLYHTWYSVIYTSICHALFYSWIHARINNWV